METHKIYTGNHYTGGSVYTGPLGKCRCGAVLKGQEQIDEHRELEHA